MATIEKWAPLPQFDVLERSHRRFFDHVGMSPVSRRRLTCTADDELILELEVPGFDASSLARCTQKSARPESTTGRYIR
jgi:hypothetical protein